APEERASKGRLHIVPRPARASWNGDGRVQRAFPGLPLIAGEPARIQKLAGRYLADVLDVTEGQHRSVGEHPEAGAVAGPAGARPAPPLVRGEEPVLLPPPPAREVVD